MALLPVVALLALALAVAGVLAVRARLAPALGYLVVGVALAATSLGRAFPETVVDGAAELGVLVLLFLIGLELDLKRLRDSLRATAWVIPFDIAVPAAGVALLAKLFGWDFGQALAAGMALAVSSTLFGERLTRHPGVPAESRRRVLGVLISEDVAAGFLLALMLVIAGGAGLGVVGWVTPLLSVGRLLFLMLLLTGAALLLVPRVLDEVARRHVHELVLLWAVGLIVLFGYLGHLAGSAELGALVAGVAAAEAGSRYVVRNSLAGLRDLALAVFFLASGLAVDVVGAVPVLPLIAAVAAVFLIGKTLVHVPAAVAAGLQPRAALQTAFALGTVGEFTLILVAVAEKEGLAHADLRAVVVGTMVVLLFVSSLLMYVAPASERAYWRIPARARAPLGWIVHALRRGRSGAVADPEGKRRRAVRLLLSNLLLVAAWGFFAAWLYRQLLSDLARQSPFWAPVLFLGAALAVAAPLLRGAYRAYRDLVWLFVGLRPGERVGAGRVRARLVDAWTATTAFLVLVFVALRVPQTLPVVLGAGFVAVILATVAWRQLARFHDTLEGTLTRVLGEDAEAGELLDRVLQRYPWGVRFAAVPIPPGSPVAGRTVKESRIAELTGAMVAVVQRRQEEIVNPQPDEMLHVGDTLVLLGDQHQIGRAEALVVAHGEALRLEAQSRSAVVEELQVKEGSDWIGRTLADTQIRDRTGTMVLGVWSGQGTHPTPYEPSRVLKAGDRLILLGTPLQVARAQHFASGVAQRAE